MSEESQINLNEMMAGDGSGLAMPPAFVFVNTKKRKSFLKARSKMIKLTDAKRVLANW